MRRRSFISHASAAMCLCGLCTSARPVSAEEHGGHHWGYDGEAGPNHWGDMAPEYAACHTGKEQSPIDLRAAIPTALPDPAIAWKPVPLKVTHNGHTIEVDGKGGGEMILDGVAYDLLQFHFHHPSEHAIDGVRAAMEAHFVHKAQDGSLAVLGVMIVEGNVNPILDAIWSVMPTEAGQSAAGTSPLDFRGLLPVDPATFRYAGSLTTPPCSEIVQWAVYRKPIAASNAQLLRFAQLFPLNARPLQPLGRRKLLLDVL